MGTFLPSLIIQVATGLLLAYHLIKYQRAGDHDPEEKADREQGGGERVKPDSSNKGITK